MHDSRFINLTNHVIKSLLVLSLESTKNLSEVDLEEVRGRTLRWVINWYQLMQIIFERSNSSIQNGNDWSQENHLALDNCNVRM